VTTRNWRPETSAASILESCSLERNLSQHAYKLVLLATGIASVLGLITLRDVGAAQPQQAKLVTASAPISQPPSMTPKIPAPGTALYETRRGDTVVSVARRYLSQTSYLTSSQLAEAIRGANGNL
jgi:hypothetical protein